MCTVLRSREHFIGINDQGCIKAIKQVRKQNIWHIWLHKFLFSHASQFSLLAPPYQVVSQYWSAPGSALDFSSDYSEFSQRSCHLVPGLKTYMCWGLMSVSSPVLCLGLQKRLAHALEEHLKHYMATTELLSFPLKPANCLHSLPNLISPWLAFLAARDKTKNKTKNSDVIWDSSLTHPTFDPSAIPAYKIYPKCGYFSPSPYQPSLRYSAILPGLLQLPPNCFLCFSPCPSTHFSHGNQNGDTFKF
jgi:hypothetical protein